MEARQLEIITSPLPFQNGQLSVVVQLEDGEEIPTLAELVDRCTPPGLKGRVGAVVMMDGAPVPKEYWRVARPRVIRNEDGEIETPNLAIRIVPLGGGGGKNPLATLLSIAVFVAAPGVGSALAANFGFGGLWVGSMFFSSAFIYQAAFSIVANLLISALAPPPKPSNFGKSPEESPTNFIEGAQNVLDPFGVVPIGLGVNRIFPKQGAEPFPEARGPDNFVRQIFNYGVGKGFIEDEKIGETDIEEFDDYEIDHKLNGDLNTGTRLYTTDIHYDGDNVALNEEDGFVIRTTQPDADGAIVDITFASGLTKFNGAGLRGKYTVQFEAQAAPTGTPEDSPLWTSPATGFKTVVGGTVTVSDVKVTTTKRSISSVNYYVGYRKDLVVLDAFFGTVSIVKGVEVKDTPAAKAPAMPSGCVLLATVVVFTKEPVDTDDDPITTIYSFSDDRQDALWSDTGFDNYYFGDSGDFVPTQDGLDIDYTGGDIKADPLNFTGAQVEALRRNIEFNFPTPGQYDIRIRRVTPDTDNDKILDKATWSALKTVKLQNPINDDNVSGAALRMRGNDQLNGSVDQYNLVWKVLVPDYDLASDTWIERISSNPASLFRYVLQGPGIATPLSDDQIDLDALAKWHTHCAEKGYTYNRYIDYETTVEEVLKDICAAGAAFPTQVDGKRTVAIDKPTTKISQMVTPRNSKEYSGSIVFKDIPHAFRVQFRNSEKGYQQDERIVYRDGYNEDNATVFEALELQSCTNADLAFKTARRHLAVAELRPEIHTFSMDIESIVLLKGNRFTLVHDVPMTGVGDARIKKIYLNDDEDKVTGFDVDDIIEIPELATYYVRARLADGSFVYREVVVTTPGDMTHFDFLDPMDIPYSEDDPPEQLFVKGDLISIVEVGQELDLIVVSIDRESDFRARITAVNYAQPDIENAEEADIPAFSSNLTTPLSLRKPAAPILLNEQSDENAMLINSDGTYLPRAIFTLRNDNYGDITTHIQIKATGTNAGFTNANILEASPDRVILTGLDDGSFYDIAIRYKRAGTLVASDPLLLNAYKFIGVSGDPIKPLEFRLSVAGDTSHFTWKKNPEPDISHYYMKFSALLEDATAETAQDFQVQIFENRLSAPFQPGTYFLYAVDRLGNMSDEAAVIITSAGSTQNVIAVIEEAPLWTGTKDNVLKIGNNLILADTSLGVGYYYFADDFDNGAKYISTLAATIVANGTFVNDLFDEDDLFDTEDIFGSGGGDIMAEDDIFALDDIFGIGADAWAVELQYRTTNDDPLGSPVWSDWTTFVAGAIEYRDIEFRLMLSSLATNISPLVSVATVNIDMPDRIERGDDLTVTAAGVEIVYPKPFKDNPAVLITLQDAAVDDKIVYTYKDATGFEFKVYNGTTAGFVTRVFDYVSSGYGEEN